ncbi:MAG: ATP-binding cassette domain-containing protein [Armatimonadota bacterium]
MSVVLHVDSVVKRYGSRPVLRKLSFDAQGGECLVIAGPNGSGKSTLLRVVAGLVRPGAGTVRLRIDDSDVSEPAVRRRAVGLVAPEISLYPELTGRENLDFFDALRGGGGLAVDGLLEQVGLSKRGGDPVSAYSTGMRQRLRIALALRHQPRVLLLDEPGLALDATGGEMLADLVSARRAAGDLVLLATNDAREAAWGDRTIVLAG